MNYIDPNCCIALGKDFDLLMNVAMPKSSSNGYAAYAAFAVTRSCLWSVCSVQCTYVVFGKPCSVACLGMQVLPGFLARLPLRHLDLGNCRHLSLDIIPSMTQLEVLSLSVSLCLT